MIGKNNDKLGRKWTFLCKTNFRQILFCFLEIADKKKMKNSRDLKFSPNIYYFLDMHS